MNRRTVILIVVAALLAGGAGVAAGLAVRGSGPRHPEISAYTHGQLSRVGPYQYCKVLNVNDCDTPGTMGVLRVNSRDAVQLSVPAAIGRAPWLLSLWYDDPADTTTTLFRPKTRLAVTIPTVDAFRGRLAGFTVQLLTVTPTPDGDLVEATHADWSVRTVWD